MKIVVAGGGIGGMTAALALAGTGHQVTVLEQSSLIGEVGAGIQVSPNARRVLVSLGLEAAFAEVATHPERIILRRWKDDSELRSTSLGDIFRTFFGHDYANVARPDLIRIFSDAARAHPKIEIRDSTKVLTAEQNESGGARVHLADGTNVDGDVVVGADGIHSRIRTSVIGTDNARFSGSIAYRMLIPREFVPDLPVETTNWLGPNGHIVTYFVGPGQTHFNVVAIIQEDTWAVESWTEKADPDEMRSRFEDWSPTIRRILSFAGDEVFRWALHDREPLEQWGSGAITLLGDACHPMLPFMAQGACQAMEDAAVLSRCLCDVEAETESVSVALRKYEGLRMERTARIQRLSWENRITYHLPDGPEQELRDQQFAEGGGGSSLAWLYGYDPLSVE